MEFEPKADNCTTSSSVKEDRALIMDELEKQKLKSDAAAVAKLVTLTYLEVDRKTAQDLESDRDEAIDETLRRQSQSWLPPVPCVTRFIGECSKPILKQLETSDVKDNQSRLALKTDYVRTEFLPMFDQSKENVMDGIRVIAYDSHGNKYEDMVFKLWGHKMYVFTRQWKQFCQDHKLISVKDKVKVWMFRDKDTQRLCVVILPILDLTVTISSRIAIRLALNKKDK